MEQDIVSRVLSELREKHCFSFACTGAEYMIQPENNKGFDYLGLWETSPRTLGLGKVFFDVMYGPEEDEVSELLALPRIGGRSFLSLYRDGEISVTPVSPD